MRSSWIGCLGCLVVLAWPALASAEPRVVVSDFKGPSAKFVRGAVVDVLEEHSVELVPPKKATQVAKSSGAELDTESGRVRVAKKLRLQAFIQGRTHVVKRKTQITIHVYNGSDGMVAAEFQTIAAGKGGIEKELRKKLWNAIGGALSEGGSGPASAIDEPTPPARAVAPEPVAAAPKSPPWRAPAAEPASEPRAATRAREPERTVRESDDELPPGVAPRREEREQSRDDEALALETHADQDEPETKRPAAFDLGVGARVGTRSFGYNDSLPGLRGYSLGPSPSIALHGHWYPAAHFTSGFAAHIGLDVRADMLVGVSSENKQGQKFSTNSHAFGVGLRGRIPVSDVLELGAVAGFGQHAFGLTDADGVDPEVPDIVHNFLRLGLEGRYQLIPQLGVQLRAGFLKGLSLGELSDKAWFPHATGNGIEAELGFQLAVTRMLSVELAAGMQRYFMALNPQEDDPGVRGTARVAGGALDKYYSSRLGVIIRP